MGTPRKQFHQGYWYHVYARSIPELCLFETNDEREWFIKKLDAIFTRRQVGLGALCLMNSHYHALVKMGPVRLDRALNGLHMSYARHLNTNRGRRSTVFEKHPGTDIVLDDSYLLQLVPYIHKNPIEAGLSECPDEYEWSTDGLYRGTGWKYNLDSWEWPPYFTGEDRSRVYRERMDEEIDPSRSDEGYIGSSDEWKDLEKRADERKERFTDRRNRRTMDEIATYWADENGLTLDQLKQPGRGQPETSLRQKAMVRMYHEGYGPTRIGDYFNRDKSAVMYAVRKEEERE